MSFGVQMVSYIIVLTIIINYSRNFVRFFRNRKMPILSMNLFSGFLIFSLLSISFESMAIYGINHMDTINAVFHRLCHQLFIGSMIIMVYFLFLYVSENTWRRKKHFLLRMGFMALPAAVALFMTIFGRLDYHIGEDGRYAYGSMVIAFYISTAIYMVWMTVLLFRKKSHFQDSAKRTILNGIAVWCLVAAVRFVCPRWFMSSIGIAVMVLLLYLSIENPRELLDDEVEKALNNKAFKEMIAELIDGDKKFYILNIVLANSQILKTSLGKKEIPSILNEAVRYFTEHGEWIVYHIKENVISVIVTEEQRFQYLMKQEMEISAYQDENGIWITPKFFANVLECPKYADTMEEVMDMIEFICMEGERKSWEGVIYTDDALKERKNYVKGVERIIQDALKNDGLEVYYQPIFSTQKKKFVSSEALVRLKDTQTLGFISPEIFVPIAEENDMIRELGDIVFRKVCAFAKESRLWDYGVEYIEVNISGIQSVDERLSEQLKECMDEYGIPPKFLNLEITETASIDAGDMLMKNIKKLKALGCGFSMDDFGTGYSNLSQMAETNFDLIKLDKSLIWPAFEEGNKKARVILYSCIEMINLLDMHIVAEGIETEQQAKALGSVGVEYLQGYYFSKPLTEEAYLKYLRDAGQYAPDSGSLES